MEKFDDKDTTEVINPSESFSEARSLTLNDLKKQTIFLISVMHLNNVFQLTGAEFL